jgi:hypothetical protein
VLFIGAAEALTQDNTNFFWDNTNNWLGIQTAAPTHALTVGNGGKATAGAVYNTADQVTNYERLVTRWDSNVAQILTQAGGTGTNRALRLLNADAVAIGLNTANSASGNIELAAGSSSNASFIGARATATSTSSSGIPYGFEISHTLNQSGTAGYTTLRIVSTETATGSGTKKIIEAFQGVTSRMSLENDGTLTAATVRGTAAIGGLTDSGYWFLGSSLDTRVYRDAAYNLDQRNGTNPQAYRIYNTFTDTSNYERLSLRWSSNVAQIIADEAGTGSTRNILLGSASAGVVGEYIRVDASGAATGFVQGGSSVSTATYTAATLANVTVTNSAGTYIGCVINPTINAGGTSSMVGCVIGYTETGSGVGSGGAKICEFKNTGTTWLYISATGKLGFSASNTQTTVGAAGAGSALPATPEGYLKIEIGGNSYLVPYYNS